MPINIVSERKITVGSESVLEGPAPAGSLGVFFEDDGQTGYFYAVDDSLPDHPIQNALHIYNVDNVSDKHIPSVVAIGWSIDNLKSVLLINDHPHAIFDFSTKRGYCRTGFPPPSKTSGWLGHEWDDSASNLFA